MFRFSSGKKVETLKNKENTHEFRIEYELSANAQRMRGIQ